MVVVLIEYICLEPFCCDVLIVVPAIALSLLVQS